MPKTTTRKVVRSKEAERKEAERNRTFTENKKTGKAQIQFKSYSEIRDLKDLIRICEIDTATWKIDKYIQNFWAGNYQVKAYLSRRSIENDLEMQKQALLKIISTNVPRPKTIKRKKTGRLLELALFDLHIGKLAWSPESGDDYDIKTAVKRYKDAVAWLLSEIDLSTIERIVLPVGNDFINVDYKTNTTTAGTPQTCDSRFGKMLIAAKKLLVDVIENLREIAPVDVLVVPGNHDENTMFSVGEILDAWYRNDKDVNIANSPKLRKFYQYGQCMLMFTHGSDENHKDLGNIAATEEPKMWGETKYREVHLGHLHKSKKTSFVGTDEYQGFKIRIMPSLSGTDAWHYKKGYMSNKGAEAFIWDRERGLVANIPYNL